MGVQVVETQMGKLRAWECAPVSDPAPLVVLCHGYGAPGTDLVGLAEALQLPQCRFVFPEAPLALEGVPFEGRAWWNIEPGRFMALQMQLMANPQADVMELAKPILETPPSGLEEAREAFETGLNQLLERFQPTSLITGGFSQGSMVAIDNAVYGERRYTAHVVLSGAPVALPAWEQRLRHRVMAPAPVFQSHGTSDPILPFPVGEALMQFLRRNGHEVAWHPFPGQHEIPRSVLQNLRTFLDTHIGDTPPA